MKRALSRRCDILMPSAGFLQTEDGAVTTDWVVLTATLVLLAGAVILPMRNEIVALALWTDLAIGGTPTPRNDPHPVPLDPSAGHESFVND